MISVIVPVYNGERHIRNLIECFDHQSYQDFEVIFVDDGSADGSAEIIKKLSTGTRPYTIRLHQQQNAGVSGARNAGFQLAEGEYVCFVDVDDCIHENYLTWLYRAVCDTRCNVALGHITRSAREWAHNEGNAGAILFAKLDFLREFLYRGKFYSICACIIRSDTLRIMELSFREGFRYSEDVHLLWRLFAREQSVAVIQRPIYFYADNPGSAMQRMDSSRMDAICLMTELEGYIQQYAPEFSVEFCKYAVARHYWSILWQAAGYFAKYRLFREYHQQFLMRENLKKLYDYPDKRIILSSRFFCLSQRLFYYIIHYYVKLR